MRYTGDLIAVLDIYPGPVIVDRLPLEDRDGRLKKPPHRRHPDAPRHASPLADWFPVLLESPGGTAVSESAIARVMERRLNTPPSVLHRMVRLTAGEDSE